MAPVQIHMFYKVKKVLWVFVSSYLSMNNAFLLYKTCVKMGMKMLN